MRLDLISDICMGIIRLFLKPATPLKLPGRLNSVRTSCCFENTSHLRQTKGKSPDKTQAPPLKE